MRPSGPVRVEEVVVWRLKMCGRSCWWCCEERRISCRGEARGVITRRLLGRKEDVVVGDELM